MLCCVLLSLGPLLLCTLKYFRQRAQFKPLTLFVDANEGASTPFPQLPMKSSSPSATWACWWYVVTLFEKRLYPRIAPSVSSMPWPHKWAFVFAYRPHLSAIAMSCQYGRWKTTVSPYMAIDHGRVQDRYLPHTILVSVEKGKEDNEESRERYGKLGRTTGAQPSAVIPRRHCLHEQGRYIGGARRRNW